MNIKNVILRACHPGYCVGNGIHHHIVILSEVEESSALSFTLSPRTCFGVGIPKEFINLQ
ncbi:MAG: hypothetical protein IJ905_10050 [Fibrobacter sp.]|nr:hypothetical protein [Fibrobacter sp.]